MRDVVANCLASLDGDASSFVARFLFPAGLEVFEGHFPGHPLVPGVFLIEAARVAAERILGRAVAITAVRDARFTAPVAPGVEVALHGSLEAGRCRAECPGVCRVDIDIGVAVG